MYLLLQLYWLYNCTRFPILSKKLSENPFQLNLRQCCISLKRFFLVLTPSQKNLKWDKFNNLLKKMLKPDYTIVINVNK